MVFMVSAQTAEYLAERAERPERWCLSTDIRLPMGGVANTPWTYRSLLFRIGSTGLGLRRIAVTLRHRRTRSALDQAKAVAGDEHVGVGAAGIVQQCIKAGLLDEIHVDLVHVLLGGVSLFDHLGTGPIDLQSTRVIDGTGVAQGALRADREGWVAQARKPSLDATLRPPINQSLGYGHPVTERPPLEAAVVERFHASFTRQGAMATLGAELARRRGSRRDRGAGRTAPIPAARVPPCGRRRRRARQRLRLRGPDPDVGRRGRC